MPVQCDSGIQQLKVCCVISRIVMTTQFLENYLMPAVNSCSLTPIGFFFSFFFFFFKAELLLHHVIQGQYGTTSFSAFLPMSRE